MFLTPYLAVYLLYRVLRWPVNAALSLKLLKAASFASRLLDAPSDQRDARGDHARFLVALAGGRTR